MLQSSQIHDFCEFDRIGLYYRYNYYICNNCNYDKVSCMDKISVNNPFVVGKYISDEYFCDREHETATLLKHIENGRNVALISPRRLGKTGLIEHLFNQDCIRNTYHTFFVDIYATSSIAEFVYLFGKEIFRKLKPRSEEWKERFFSIVKSLRLGLKIDPLTGETKFDLGLGDIQTPLTTLDEIFEYIEQADRPCLIAIDEFQRVGRYKEENVEELLRTKIQHCRQTTFIFSGSERNTIANMFNSSAKPFYQSAISMGLEPIPMETYVGFAKEKFASRGKEITSKAVCEVYSRFEGCTWFVQMIMNELFALTEKGGTCDESVLPEADALEIAREVLMKSFGRSAEWTIHSGRESYFDITDPEKPLWKFFFTHFDGVEQKKYVVRLDAKTGGIVKAFEWNDACESHERY